MERLLCLISGMNTGGAETFLMKVYRQLDKSKYQMDFCVNVFEECFYDKEIKSMGGRIFHIPSKSDDHYKFVKSLKSIVSDNKYERVIRITSNGMGFFDLKIAKDAGAKVCIARSSNSSDGRGLKLKLAHFIGRMLYKKYVDVKLAPSDLAAIYTFGKKDYKNGKVTILHNAVDLDIYNYSVQNRMCIRKEFGISESQTVIGHVGRFNKQKNHPFLINVFYEYLKKDPNAVLMLIGDGPDRADIVSLIKARNIEAKVIFTGVRKDVSSMLSAMDVFVFPSFYEGMPNTVIEAQATGLPCIISDTITNEANITGLVTYLSIEKPAKEWVKGILKCKEIERCNTRDMFIKQKYDIESLTDEFIKRVFI